MVRFERACACADMHHHLKAVQFRRFFVENAGRHAHSGGIPLEGDALNEGILYTVENCLTLIICRPEDESLGPPVLLT